MVVAQGVDYSFARPSPAGLFSAGMRFAGRYIGPGSGKLLSSQEARSLHAAGLDIFLLVEEQANSALGGFNVGVRHAQQAVAAANLLGVPGGAAYYFAVDFDTTISNWGLVREYLRGAGTVVGPARVGIYGGVRAMQWAARDGVAAWFFQTYAWSGGQWYPGNHVEQWLNGQIVAGGEVDLCRSMRAEFGQWRAHEEDGMQQYFFARDGATNTYWLCDGMFARGPLTRPASSGDQPVGRDEIADIKTLAREGMFTLWRDGQIREGMVSAFGLKIPWAGGGSGGGGGATPAEVSIAVRAELNKTVLPAVPGRLGLGD